MQELIHRLMRPGGLEVARRLRSSQAFWLPFHASMRRPVYQILIGAIAQAQFAYEAAMHPYLTLAKESMAATCLGSIYDYRAGWTVRRRAYAERLIAAFAKAPVSLEVHATAREAVMLYGLTSGV